MVESARLNPGWRWLRLTVLAAGFLMAAQVAEQVAAQDIPRIGFVNTERILREANIAKSAQQKLEQEFSRRDKEVQEMAARLKQMSERLDREAAVTPDADRLRRQREFADLDKEFQRKQREFREDLNQRRNEELASVVERANRVIKQIAEQEKYDLILQESVFASARIDLTEKVLRTLNAVK